MIRLQVMGNHDLVIKIKNDVLDSLDQESIDYYFGNDVPKVEQENFLSDVKDCVAEDMYNLEEDLISNMDMMLGGGILVKVAHIILINDPDIILVPILNAMISDRFKDCVVFIKTPRVVWHISNPDSITTLLSPSIDNYGTMINIDNDNPFYIKSPNDSNRYFKFELGEKGISLQSIDYDVKKEDVHF